MATVKEQMLQARDLIQQKRYAEARAILIDIEHPTADAWLDKIAEITAAKPAGKPQTVSSVARSPKPQRSPLRRGLNLVLFVIVVTVVGVGGMMLADQLINGESRAAQSAMIDFCMDAYFEAGIYEGVTRDCFDWRDSAFPAYDDQVIACHRRSDGLESEFRSCMIREDIIPYLITFN
jgi:hypothetical protein